MGSLNSIDASEGKYVIIDEGSYSAAIIILAFLKRFEDDTVLVGAPTGASACEIFGGGFAFNLPNMKTGDGMGAERCFNAWHGYNEEALMQNISI